MTTISRKPNTAHALIYFGLVLALIIGLVGTQHTPVSAANPFVQQIYYLSLPEDDLLQLFDDDDALGGTFPDPVSPIRSITGISISSTGTWVYYDQWEDGGYDALISEPGTNVYSAANPDGTQIWGDGVLANGCPPSINNVPNACLVAADDQLSNGDVIILDNDVAVAGTNPGGPYSRNAAQIFFDGRDKIGASFPVAVTRGAFPVSPGSVMAGGSEVLDTNRWGTAYEAPLGENTSNSNTNAFEDVRWFIMAGAGGATIDVDANGDGDLLDANDLNDFVMTEGAKVQVNGILMGATLTVVSGNPVQVNSMTADVNDTFEFRWDALIPRDNWSNDYYTPVGTQPKTSNSGCTEVEVYNPNTTTITINYDFPGGSSPNGSFTVAAGTTATGQTTPATPIVPYNNGGRYWSTGGEIFLPISVTDCTRDTSATDGRLYDWGNPLFPVDQLTDQALVGWAPGCSNESLVGICEDPDITTGDVSRNVVWVTPLADTTIYIDTDGSGITCPGGAGSEQTISPANALVSYRINDDPSTSNKVRDDFGAVNYGNNNGTQNWSTSWDETGDNDAAGSGSILITGGTLRITGAGSIGDTIERQVNLSGQVFSDLTFQLTSSGNLDADDELRVDVSNDGGATWRTLATYKDDPTTTVKAIIMSPYNSANTRIRFRQVNDLAAGEYWNIDQVQIKYAPDGDYDMTGARIETCDGTPFAAAWGQDPALSAGNDEEALDLGTGVAPLGTRLVLDKSADKTEVPVGGLVNYTFEVINRGSIALSNVNVFDNKCSPVVYSSGDTNSDNILQPFPAETWTFTCSSNIFVDTTNVAYASGWTGTQTILSAPDEWEVKVIQPAVIGNYVWLDEDGDGDQDAGEAGIPNMKVELCADAACTTVLQTTYTDVNGGYLFDGLAPGTYYVRTSPVAALNQTYDENGALDNVAQVTVVAGDEHLTADFGYNWSTQDETNDPDPDATGAIGDRVWIDANADGVQDLGEAGLGGVTVTLHHDPDGDGVYDTVYGTTVTDAAGNYIFDNLPPAGYVVEVTPPAGYAQTGDPDSLLDNMTTNPIILGPGDVYVNADFGYNPTGDSSTIGDTVWYDLDADGVQDLNEEGIAGVSVALILDDGDGVYEPGIDQIIATDITDENGLYEFPDLPAGTYFVAVTDTANVLGELAPSYDADGGATEISKVTVDGVNDNYLQDFGYTPPGQGPGEGVIGDQVWLDRDGDGFYDPGEGLEGVKLTLTDPGADGILGTADDYTRETFTDENGFYSFGNLEPSLSYRVTVDTTTLPAGVTNTVDPDGTNDSTTVRNLAITGPIDLGADFAYRDLTNPNTIGGTIWEDTDADGTLNEGGFFEGVTVVLYDSDGNIVATTTTDSNGNYSFSGLPDGTYTVDVTDDYNVLNGYWHSDGPNDNQDNNSQTDPYTVTVAGGQTNTTADFGYYIEPAALGDWIWLDDGDGIQDTGESGIAGATVELTITYPNGVITTITTVTDANGFYSFENLLLDEDYIGGTGGGQPTYAITVTPTNLFWLTSPAGTIPGDDDDSGLAPGETIWTIRGSTNETFDYGFYAPTAVFISADVRYDPLLDAFVIDWSTNPTDEIQISGYNLLRKVVSTGEIVTLEHFDAKYIDPVYSYEDRDFKTGEYYIYSVEVFGLDTQLFTTITLEPHAVFKQYVPTILR